MVKFLADTRSAINTFEFGNLWGNDREINNFEAN